NALTEMLQEDFLSSNQQFFLWHTWFADVFNRSSNQGFDVVIGNPPYVDIKGMPKDDVKLFFKMFSTCENRINLYAMFIEKGMNLLSNKGLLCFINPNSMLMNESYQKTRKLLVDNIATIIKLPDSVFLSATVETIIFIAKKTNTYPFVYGNYFKNDAAVDFSDLTFKRFERNIWSLDPEIRFNIFCSEAVSKLLVRLQSNSMPLSNYVDTSLGITPYDKAKGHSQELIKQRQFHASYKKDSTYVPLISGKNIFPFTILGETDEYLSYGEWLGAAREKRFFTEPRIIVRQIVGGTDLRIIAAYEDKTPTYFTQIGFSLLSKNNNVKELKFILALLNSKLLSFYHKNKFLDIEKVVFQKVLIANAKQLPIPNATAAQQQPIIDLVDRILSAKKANPQADTSALESEIDRLVYQLYGLTEEEIKVVEQK
ncbi:MAG: N-6 DNA methylase, partial [Bacteroidales bacterium]|nr:N-6 DNA methylase [Bacteroidales bacterium]